MPRKPKQKDDNGFAAWGGYMEAKKAKLAEQYRELSSKQVNRRSNIFEGVAIMVNGYTKPSADELKLVMAEHGGTYHLYQNQGGIPTTHVIASNLPNVKINQLGDVPVVRADWIMDSVEANKLLDFAKYLLYTNHSRTQPKLNFAVLEKTKLSNELPQVTSGTVISKLSSPKYAKTAADPEFLSEFYNNSRLHLIATLGAELKQFVNKLREESKREFPGLERLLLARDNRSTDERNALETNPIIMHIDMDCFFVSVGLRNRPDLYGRPVAVTHSRTGRSSTHQMTVGVQHELHPSKLTEGDEASSMAEIASCSYEARQCGVRNGMFMGYALNLCPDLIPIPYDFQDYKDVSSMLYHIIAEYSVDIEAVSCDEMYVDVTKVLKKTGLTVEQWATHIRHEVMERTGCPCSTGFGANKLQARLATKKAKPNGQYYLRTDDVESYMYELPLKELPGVGDVILNKLHNFALKTCGDIYDVPLSTLKKELGQKIGEIIYNQARGIDHKQLSYNHERKSVSADVNYGIRFRNIEEALTFLESLSKEVYSRLAEIKKRAKTITLKLLVRAEGAPKETAKYLGCGICNALNKSITTHYYLDTPQAIFKEAKILFKRLNVIPEDLRGVGIQLSNLQNMSRPNKALATFLSKSDHPISSDLQIMSSSDAEEKGFVPLNPQTANSENKAKENDDATVSIQSSLPHFKAPSCNKTTKSKVPTKQSNASRKNMLTHYFRKTKTETSNKAKGGDIDLNILKELPSALQKEIIEEYSLPLALLEAQSEPSLSTSNLFHDKQQPILGNSGGKSQKNMPETKGFTDLTKTELKTLLKSWIDKEDVPKTYDVDMLASFLTSLAENKRIDYLFSIVNFLHRHISKKCCRWHVAYYRIFNKFQEAMLSTYGNTLFVPKEFSCSNHLNELGRFRKH